MRMTGSRGLMFHLGADRRTITVTTDEADHDKQVELASWESSTELDEDTFTTECGTWSAALDDAHLIALRSGAGAYPLVRSRYDQKDKVWRVYVTVETVGKAAGVVRVAETYASLVANGLVMTDRAEGARTSDGIEYAFTFASAAEVNASRGVEVSEIPPGEFRCVSEKHEGAEIPATIRVEAPVLGTGERKSLTLCAQCWAEAVVNGLDLAQYGRPGCESCGA